VKLKDEFEPFLRPNQYADYSKDSKCVKQAKKLASSSSDEKDYISKVYDYINERIKYDKKKAASMDTGYIPEPDSTLAEGKGICFDYASLAASMLRSMGVPTKIIFGYVEPNDLYHAWNMFYTEEDGWTSVEFKVNPNDWNRIDLTFSANGEDEEFIGDGSNYTDVYKY
jgi:transglutaminase-like putative cysteine protease